MSFVVSNVSRNHKVVICKFVEWSHALQLIPNKIVLCYKNHVQVIAFLVFKTLFLRREKR